MIHIRILSFLLIFILISGLFSCSNESKDSSGIQADINAEVKNLPAETQIFLSQVDVTGPKAVDSTKSDKDGKFSFKVPSDVERMYLIIAGDQRLPVFLEPGLHNLNADYKQFYASAVFTNSPLTNFLRKVEGIRQGFDLVSRNLQYAFQEAMVSGNRLKGDSIEKEFTKILSANKKNIKHLIDSIGPGPVSHLATSMLSVDEDFGYLDSLATRFEKEKPNAVYTKKIKSFLEVPRKLGLGRLAPDFSQPDPNGKEIKLSEFKGKWVLLDFWASWCKPCRAENPFLVASFKKYKQKGFNVLSISLDSQKDPWMKAMIADKLFWAHGSDLKGFENSSAQLYGINSIPASFLINPEGKIVAKNLRGEELDRKLAEVLK